MAQSFFDLTGPASALDPHEASLAALSPEDVAALDAEAEPLYQALRATLEGHCQTHHVSVGACLHAVYTLVSALEYEIAADEADA